LHKLWVSRRLDRSPAQLPRDRAQAAAIAALVLVYLSFSFESRDLSALKMAKTWLNENPIIQDEQ